MIENAIVRHTLAARRPSESLPFRRLETRALIGNRFWPESRAESMRFRGEG
jgi:hypothetical protein